MRALAAAVSWSSACWWSARLRGGLVGGGLGVVGPPDGGGFGLAASGGVLLGLPGACLGGGDLGRWCRDDQAFRLSHPTTSGGRRRPSWSLRSPPEAANEVERSFQTDELGLAASCLSPARPKRRGARTAEKYRNRSGSRRTTVDFNGSGPTFRAKFQTSVRRVFKMACRSSGGPWGSPTSVASWSIVAQCAPNPSGGRARRSGASEAQQ
jgi:hypothetical protein